MHLIEAIVVISVNDIIFLMIHLVLLYCVIRSVYLNRYKPGITTLLNKVRNKHNSVYFRIKKSMINMLGRQKLNHKNQQVIIADSTLSVSVTGNARISVLRDEASWGYFSLAWTVVSVFIIEANGLYSTKLTEDYTILILVIDLAAVTYLCFLSSWFRGKIMQIVNIRNKTPD